MKKLEKLERTRDLEIRGEKPLRGTLKWWEDLPKKVFIEGNQEGNPVLYLELDDRISFLAEIAYEKDDSCIQMNGCNVALVVGWDQRFDQALFYFPVSEKCRLAIDEFIETEVNRFVAWWKQA